MADEFSPYGDGGWTSGEQADGSAVDRRKKKPGNNLGGVDAMVAREQLKTIVARIERLEEEKKAIGDDIRDVYAEAKANGFDTKVLRQVVAIRKQDLAERQEQEAVRDLYLQALGMLPDFEPAEKKE